MPAMSRNQRDFYIAKTMAPSYSIIFINVNKLFFILEINIKPLCALTSRQCAQGFYVYLYGSK